MLANMLRLTLTGWLMCGTALMSFCAEQLAPLAVKSCCQADAAPSVRQCCCSDCDGKCGGACCKKQGREPERPIDAGPADRPQPASAGNRAGAARPDVDAGAGVRTDEASADAVGGCALHCNCDTCGFKPDPPLSLPLSPARRPSNG